MGCSLLILNDGYILHAAYASR